MVGSMPMLLRGRSRKIERRGSRCTQSVPCRIFPPPPGNYLHFFFSEVGAFSGKNSAQNLINYIKILTAIINSYQSCSNSNDPLNILHECCDTNLLMISFNYMSTKRGGGRTPWTPPWICPWCYKFLTAGILSVLRVDHGSYCQSLHNSFYDN